MGLEVSKLTVNAKKKKVYRHFLHQWQCAQAQISNLHSDLSAGSFQQKNNALRCYESPSAKHHHQVSKLVSCCQPCGGICSGSMATNHHHYKSVQQQNDYCANDMITKYKLGTVFRRAKQKHCSQVGYTANMQGGGILLVSIYRRACQELEEMPRQRSDAMLSGVSQIACNPANCSSTLFNLTLI